MKNHKQKIISKHIKGAIKGNESSATFLYNQFIKKIYLFCFFLCNDKILAQDLSQQTFIKAFRNLKSLKKDEAFYSWLCKISKRLFFDHKRSPQSIPKENIDDYSNQEAIRSNHDLRDLISKVLSTLSENERLAIILVCYQGHSYKEAATQIGINEHSLRVVLHNAKNHFIERIEAYQIEITGIFNLKDKKDAA